MSFLCERQAAALRIEQGVDPIGQDEEQVMNPGTYHELQTRFLQDHLTAWFPQLHRSIQANTRSSLYRGLAQITEAFLAQESSSRQMQTFADELSGPG